VVDIHRSNAIELIVLSCLGSLALTVVHLVDASRDAHGRRDDKGDKE
jgi:hypothetical protein